MSICQNCFGIMPENNKHQIPICDKCIKQNKVFENLKKEIDDIKKKALKRAYKNETSLYL